MEVLFLKSELHIRGSVGGGGYNGSFASSFARVLPFLIKEALKMVIKFHEVYISEFKFPL